MPTEWGFVVGLVAGMPSAGLEPELPQLRVLVTRSVPSGPRWSHRSHMFAGNVCGVGLRDGRPGLGDPVSAADRPDLSIVNVKAVVREPYRLNQRSRGGGAPAYPSIPRRKVQRLPMTRNMFWQLVFGPLTSHAPID